MNTKLQEVQRYKHTLSTYTSKLHKTNIYEYNYSFYTLTTTSAGNQKDNLINYLTKLDIPFVAALEYTSSEQKANGWHLHIISQIEPQKSKGIQIHQSYNYKGLKYALRYLSKTTANYKEFEKQHYYNCGNQTRDLFTFEPISNQQLKLDFSPIYIEKTSKANEKRESKTFAATTNSYGKEKKRENETTAANDRPQRNKRNDQKRVFELVFRNLNAYISNVVFRYVKKAPT